MAVYVDNMRAKFGRMIMCHMIADTSEELHTMAGRIGLQRKWCQHEGTYKEHYDVSLTRRAIAIQHGAIEISRKTLVTRLRARKNDN
jgi:hypothetical protein